MLQAPAGARGGGAVVVEEPGRHCPQELYTSCTAAQQRTLRYWCASRVRSEDWMGSARARGGMVRRGVRMAWGLGWARVC